MSCPNERGSGAKPFGAINLKYFIKCGKRPELKTDLGCVTIAGVDFCREVSATRLRIETVPIEGDAGSIWQISP